ncbi:DUF6640 family protein [Planctobacterium marinum]|uniref:Uncharacterized protein n=1 Tax=Planctobacterium marinum TaxID=1631968 RepID=A0AA48KUY7_9ALTE|nr:hypothetical protein MACH26_24560 [Planctobacterium marinum]
MKRHLISKLTLTLGAILYLAVIPYLEWNDSHVFNPDWPAHARFHEVWQLSTNIALGILVLWLCWRRSQFVLSGVINCLVMGGVLVSHALSDHIGSTVKSGNIAKLILGQDLAVIVALIVVLSSITVVLNHRKTAEKQ